jgi:hypothetical protein
MFRTFEFDRETCSVQSSIFEKGSKLGKDCISLRKRMDLEKQFLSENFQNERYKEYKKNKDFCVV